jgi:hypothetical protein
MQYIVHVEFEAMSDLDLKSRKVYSWRYRSKFRADIANAKTSAMACGFALKHNFARFSLLSYNDLHTLDNRWIADMECGLFVMLILH